MSLLYRKGSFTYQFLKIEKLKFANTATLERFAGYRSILLPQIMRGVHSRGKGLIQRHGV